MSGMSAAFERLAAAVERAEAALQEAEAKGDLAGSLGAYGETQLLRERQAELDPRGTQQAMDDAGADVLSGLLKPKTRNDDTTTTGGN